MAALLAWVHYQIAMRFDAGDGIPLVALGGERNVGLALQMTAGLLSAVMICRAAWREVAKPSDESDMTEGLGAAFGRAVGTSLLMLALVAAFVFMAFFCTMFAGIKVAEALSMPHEAAAVLAFAFAAAVVAIILVSVSRWMLAVPLSAVFKMAGAGATDESSALLRGRRWRSLLFLVVSGLVSCNFAAPLRCIGLCDVLNIAHPFTEWPASGKLAWGALISATGTLADIAVLFGFVALVVYARRLKEPLAADARPPRRLAVLLVATGLVLAVAVPTLAFMRSPGGFLYLDEARVFRIENMSEDEAPSMNDIGWHLRGNCGARWFEKRSFLDLFSRDRIIWVERPFCRHCGKPIGTSRAAQQQPAQRSTAYQQPVQAQPTVRIQQPQPQPQLQVQRQVQPQQTQQQNWQQTAQQAAKTAQSAMRLINGVMTATASSAPGEMVIGQFGSDIFGMATAAAQNVARTAATGAANAAMGAARNTVHSSSNSAYRQQQEQMRQQQPLQNNQQYPPQNGQYPRR